MYIFIYVGVIMNDETVHQLCKQAVSQVNLFDIKESNYLNFFY